MASSSAGVAGGQFLAGDKALLAGVGGGGVGEQGVVGGVPANAREGEAVDDDSRLGVVLGSLVADGLLRAGVLEVGASPVTACLPQRAQRGGVAAALRGEVAAEAEHVRPAAQPPVPLVPLLPTVL